VLELALPKSVSARAMESEIRHRSCRRCRGGRRPVARLSGLWREALIEPSGVHQESPVRTEVQKCGTGRATNSSSARILALGPTAKGVALRTATKLGLAGSLILAALLIWIAAASPQTGHRRNGQSSQVSWPNRPPSHVFKGEQGSQQSEISSAGDSPVRSNSREDPMDISCQTCTLTIAVTRTSSTEDVA